jgi:hypothetical protein
MWVETEYAGPRIQYSVRLAFWETLQSTPSYSDWVVTDNRDEFWLVSSPSPTGFITAEVE